MKFAVGDLIYLDKSYWVVVDTAGKKYKVHSLGDKERITLSAELVDAKAVYG
jgi:NMD protein affecting ribosome stability and mRNA decay